MLQAKPYLALSVHILSRLKPSDDVTAPTHYYTYSNYLCERNQGKVFSLLHIPPTAFYLSKGLKI